MTLLALTWILYSSWVVYTLYQKHRKPTLAWKVDMTVIGEQPFFRAEDIDKKNPNEFDTRKICERIARGDT